MLRTRKYNWHNMGRASCCCKWVLIKTQKTFRTSLSQRGAKVFLNSIWLIALILHPIALIALTGQGNRAFLPAILPLVVMI